MTSLPNRHNSAPMPEWYRPAFRAENGTLHQHTFFRVRVPIHFGQGRGNGAAT